MHSFHHSRGRIAFDVLCALTISASCVGAWLQTGASSFMPAAAAAALYAIVRAFDWAKSRRSLAASMAVIETAADNVEEVRREGVTARSPVGNGGPSADPVPTTELAEPATVEKPKRRRAKAPRKVAKIPVKPALTEIETVDPAIASPEPDFATPVSIAPLFEPEPFVRQQRTVFGRKAG